MILAQTKFWRAQLGKGRASVSLSTLKDALPADLEELKDLRIELPLSEWQRVVKQLRSDRKLLGGILLDFARAKEQLPLAIANDRLLSGLQSVATEATLALVEEGLLRLVPVEPEA